MAAVVDVSKYGELLMNNEYDTPFSIYAPLNEERRYNHGNECLRYGERTGDYRGRLFVTRTKKGWKWYCHNCGTGGFVSYSTHDMVEIIKNGVINHSLEETPSDYWEPPANMGYIPEHIAEWVEKYVPINEVLNRGAYVTPDERMLVFPVMFGDIKLGWQARMFHKEGEQKGPKYLTKVRIQTIPWAYRVTDGNRKMEDVCVIVEDIVSAIKVGRIVDTYAITGSPKRLGAPLAFELEEKYDHCLVWFDMDKASHSATVARQLNSLYDLWSGSIITEKDPKELSYDEIAHQLKSVITYGDDAFCA